MPDYTKSSMFGADALVNPSGGFDTLGHQAARTILRTPDGKWVVNGTLLPGDFSPLTGESVTQLGPDYKPVGVTRYGMDDAPKGAVAGLLGAISPNLFAQAHPNAPPDNSIRGLLTKLINPFGEP